jgi:hypothetical protein
MMKKVFAINGSPRHNGNSGILLDAFLKGTMQNDVELISYKAKDLNIYGCTGCLRCNLIKRCAIRNDDWEKISAEIIASDVIVIASPVYFHHFPASVKSIVDRFRSFIKVTITEKSIEHIPWTNWEKDFVLLLPMGSSDSVDAKPIVELFEFMTEILGTANKLHVVTATRLGVSAQISFGKEQLEELYKKIQFPICLAENDYIKNQRILNECFELGNRLTK